MPQPYDASSRFLADQFPRDWLALAGWPTIEPIELIDANLSTVTAEADKLIRIAGPAPWLAHVELQSSRDFRLDCR